MPSIAIGRPNMQDAFRVFLNGREIDTVYWASAHKMTADEVRKSLVDHDGYDSRIKVVKRNF